jgi:anti-sigma regulatory factor (Ser/Thr protein kinase)
MAIATRTGTSMTGHRAAPPVTAEVGGPMHDDLLTASRPERLRTSGPLLCAPALPGGAGGAAPAQPTATCTLSARPESVKSGRAFTRMTLADWGMAELTDMAELVVSELMTNALRHGVPAARAADGQTVRLRLLAQPPFVMCMVTDPGTEIPVLRDSDLAAESGRGLQVVEACSVRWGWHLLDEGGKVVWALLR